MTRLLTSTIAPIFTVLFALTTVTVFGQPDNFSSQKKIEALKLQLQDSLNILEKQINNLLANGVPHGAKLDSLTKILLEDSIKTMEKRLINYQAYAKDRLSAYRQTADSVLQTGWYYLTDSANSFKRQLGKDTLYYFIEPTPIVTAKNIIKTKIYTSKSGHVGLSMKLDPEGTESWSIATGKSIGRQLAFIIDNKLMQVPKVNSQITGGMTALNRGDISKDELKKIKKIIDTQRK